jgi:hypothetical protein
MDRWIERRIIMTVYKEDGDKKNRRRGKMRNAMREMN